MSLCGMFAFAGRVVALSVCRQSILLASLPKPGKGNGQAPRSQASSTRRQLRSLTLRPPGSYENHLNHAKTKNCSKIAQKL
eukprot:558245-Amphidinium_carterae.1